MKFKSLAIALVLVILSALPVAAQPVTCRVVVGVTSGVSGSPIKYKADATAVSTAYGANWITVLVMPVPGTLGCPAPVGITVTAVDAATGAPATWLKLGRQPSVIPWIETAYPTPPPAGPAYTMNTSNTLITQVEKNVGAARSATLTLTVTGGTLSSLQFVTVTQAGQ